ncbi:hypothetical protein [Paenibacillus larvae]|uniref:hypothetical protein n=1 Tax=Paenibacillus larvae TaxID=1464 RepID=UPI002891179C|nr:hypothetical protein [Paenibacillus larvae]MDT2194018.1 hypothetical protein [Paenibacillus larvae]
MKVADAPTKEEALEGNWRDLVDQGKILTVPVPENEIYIIGEKSKCLFHGYDCVTSPLQLHLQLKKYWIKSM